MSDNPPTTSEVLTSPELVVDVSPDLLYSRVGNSVFAMSGPYLGRTVGVAETGKDAIAIVGELNFLVGIRDAPPTPSPMDLYEGNIAGLSYALDVVSSGHYSLTESKDLIERQLKMFKTCKEGA